LQCFLMVDGWITRAQSFVAFALPQYWSRSGFTMLQCMEHSCMLQWSRSG